MIRTRLSHTLSPSLALRALLVTLLAASPAIAGQAPAGQKGQSATPADMRERLNRIGGDVFSRPDRIKEAIRELKAILAQDPTSSEAHLLLGIAYRTGGSPEMVGEAKAELVQAVELNPANVAARFYLASLYLELGRPAKAKEELEAALVQAPGRPQFLALLAEAERQLKNPQRAVELARQALAPDESFAQARYYLALALFDLDKPADAIKELERVTAAAPTVVEPFLGLGSAYIDAGRLDEALATLRKGVLIDRGRRDLHIQMARAYRLKALPLRADQELLLAKPSPSAGPGSSSFDQQHVDADFQLETGLLRLQQGRLKAAQEALQQVLDMDPDHGPATRGLAELYLQQRSYARAGELADRAEKLGAPLSEAKRTLLQAGLRGGK